MNAQPTSTAGIAAIVGRGRSVIAPPRRQELLQLSYSQAAPRLAKLLLRRCVFRWVGSGPPRTRTIVVRRRALLVALLRLATC